MQATKIEILFVIFLYLSILCISFNAIFNILEPKKIKTRYLFIVMLLMFVYAYYGGDYYHLKEDFANVKSGDVQIEYPYYFIANYLSFNYTTFRLVVWGFALFFINKTYRRLSNSYLPLYVVAILFTLNISYARASLAMSIMFYGASFYFVPIKRHRFLSMLLSFLLLFLSYFFHKSALFGIAMILLSYVVRKINRKMIILAVVSIPLLVSILKGYVENFLFGSINLENIVDVERGLHYMNDEYASSFGVAMIIQNTLAWTIFYIEVLVIIILTFAQKYNKLDAGTVAFGNITLFIIFAATFFGVIDFGVNTTLFYYRFLNFSMIPMCFFIARCLKENLCKKLNFLVISLGIMSSLYGLLYRLYLV